MKYLFKKQIVLITGGSKGIGKEIANQFFNCGASVYVTSRSNNRLIKGNHKENFIKNIKIDFSNKKETNEFIGTIKSFKKIDILINNAGINKIDNIDKISELDWDLIQEINLKTPFLMIKNISPIMKKNKYGKIINISSIFSEISKSKRAAYSASKSGLNGLTRASAIQLAKNNILVNAVSPGFVKTSLTKKILSKQEIVKLEKSLPIGRFANTKDIASLVLYLSSKKNTYITGQNIIIDGGYTIT